MLCYVTTSTRRRKILLRADDVWCGKKLKESRDEKTVKNGSHFISHKTKKIQIHQWEAVFKISQVLVIISFNPCKFRASGNFQYYKCKRGFRALCWCFLSRYLWCILFTQFSLNIILLKFNILQMHGFFCISKAVDEISVTSNNCAKHTYLGLPNNFLAGSVHFRYEKYTLQLTIS